MSPPNSPVPFVNIKPFNNSSPFKSHLTFLLVKSGFFRVRMDSPIPFNNFTDFLTHGRILSQYLHVLCSHLYSSFCYIISDFQFSNKLSCFPELLITVPFLHWQSQEPRTSLTTVKKAPAFRGHKMMKFSIDFNLLWEVWPAKLNGGWLLKAEEFGGYARLHLVAHKVTKEIKDYQRFI